MKFIHRILLAVGLFLSTGLGADTPPTVVIHSAEMRAGTTLMDVNFRVDHPTDDTVKVRALAFISGHRSFSNVIRPVTFAEGTGSLLSDATLANTDHTLTWNVGADWDIDLGEITFEILARDERGWLPFDWITIPATETTETLTISLNSPTDADVLDAFFYLYADQDEGLAVSGGIVRGSETSGSFAGIELVGGSTVGAYGAPFIMQRMDLAVARGGEMNLANHARAGSFGPNRWHASKRAYQNIGVMVGWGNNGQGRATPPAGLSNVVALAAGSNHSLALTSDGTVVGWGGTTAPSGLSNVVAIAAGEDFRLALKDDGTVLGWGGGPADEIPAGLDDVVGLAAGRVHALAVKADGTVVAWGTLPGWASYGQTTVPAGLDNVVGVAARERTSFAVKADGTLVQWGEPTPIPEGLNEVKAVACFGQGHVLALRSDGTVVGWGNNGQGQATPPAGLSNVVAIAAGWGYSLALTSDGTVVGWGNNGQGRATPPAGLSNVVAIAAGFNHSLAFVQEKTE